jgi:hypothetical protein
MLREDDDAIKSQLKDCVVGLVPLFLEAAAFINVIILADSKETEPCCK